MMFKDLCRHFVGSFFEGTAHGNVGEKKSTSSSMGGTLKEAQSAGVGEWGGTPLTSTIPPSNHRATIGQL